MKLKIRVKLDCRCPICDSSLDNEADVLDLDKVNIFICPECHYKILTLEVPVKIE